MAETTGITWTNSTLNPIIGCQRVSPGCELCYAEVQDSRKRWGGVTHWGPKAPRHRTSRSTWNQALKWNAVAAKLRKRHLVFCASLSDVFEDHPLWSDVRPELFALIRATPALTWLVLTKRPENIARLWPATMPAEYRRDGSRTHAIECPPPGAEAWPNVWLGTTVEDRKRAQRLDDLMAVQAALHWISAEPLLEDVAEEVGPYLGPRGVQWVIVGGESDMGAPAPARPFDLQWARSLKAKCDAARVPYFFKQKGSNVVDRGAPISCLGKGDVPAEWPEEIAGQHFPTARAA